MNAVLRPALVRGDTLQIGPHVSSPQVVDAFLAAATSVPAEFGLDPVRLALRAV